MSDQDFNKKIKEKLYEHESDYDSGAWEKFKPLLPVPWYTTLFQNYGGWLFGGLATSALLFTFFYQNNKNNLLNDEISTLKQELSSISQAPDTVFIEKTQLDTVFVAQVVEKYKYIETSSSAAVSPEAVEAFLVRNPAIAATFLKKQTTADQAKSTSSELVKESESEEFLNKNGVVASELPQKQNAPNTNELGKQSSTETVSQLTESDKVGKSNLIAKEQELEKEEILVTDVEEKTKENVTDSLKFEVPDELLAKSTPDKEKRKIKLPTMRLGIGSDYLGLNVLANGINAEVFLTKKLSFNTGVLFSGQVETKHPLANDFNRNTGKQFQEEFQKYNPRIPDQIKDIRINTSFIKLPLHFNYYIDTWSRFKFIVSAGTKLDLSVYQDVNFSSGSLSDQIRSRFEARPKPQVLNNLNYGMGVQYQYGNFVGQLTPYFDFRFRQQDYFTPKNNFGLSAALKYEF